MNLMPKAAENPAQDDNLRKYFDFNLKLLYLAGIEFNLNNDEPIKKSRLPQAFRLIITILMLITGFFLEFHAIVFILKHRQQKLEALQVCSELFSNLLVICKTLRMVSAIKSIQMALDEVAVFWVKYKPDPDCKVIITKAAQQTLIFCKGYGSIGIGAFLAYTYPAIHNFVYHYYIDEARNYTLAYARRVLVFKYPFEVDNTPIFLFVLTGEVYLIFMCPVCWVACDALFAQLTTHTCMQLKILHYDIKTLINYEIIEDRLKNNIRIFIKRHQALLRICRNIEDIFSPIIFATVLISSISICINIFEVKLTKATGNYSSTPLYGIMVSALFSQIFFFCSFAETLTTETGAIAETAYNCKWTEKDFKLKFYLQMIIMRSQIPFHYTACGFFPIGHERMASIITTSFSYLMILQNLS